MDIITGRAPPSALSRDISQRAVKSSHGLGHPWYGDRRWGVLLVAEEHPVVSATVGVRLREERRRRAGLGGCDG